MWILARYVCCVLCVVRTISVLGYWVLGNIHRYCIVLVLGDIFCCSDTQYNTNQTAVSTVHMPVTCTLTAAIVCLDTTLFMKHIYCHHHRVLGLLVSLLSYTLVLVLVLLGIGVARAQYYCAWQHICYSAYMWSQFCPDVRHTGGLYKKRLKLGSWNLHHRVAPWL